MVEKIINTDELDMSRGEVRRGLELDLKRIEIMDLPPRPKRADVLVIKATNGFYSDSINYDFQYGIRGPDGITPICESKRYGHEVLPWLQ